MRNWSVEKLSSLFFLILTIGSTSNVQAARFVRNEQTLTCLELTSAPSSSLSCVHVTLNTCPNNRFSVISESLKWSLTPTNSSFLTNNTEVIIKSNEFCLSASTDNNVVEACPCDNGIAQKWKLKDDSLNSVNAGKCLGLVGEEVALGNCQNWSTYHVSPNAVNLYTNAEFAGKPEQLFVNSYNKASLPVEIFSSPFSLEIPPGFEFIVDRGNNNVKKFEFDVAQMQPIESDSTVIIKLKPGMTIYEHPAYFGASKFIEAGPTTINDAIIVGSALLPEGFRGVFWQNSNSTGNNFGLFEPIVNFTAATKQNSFNSLDISSTKCKNECGSGGYCSDEGTCICKPGFTGERCEQCSDGFFGPDCQKCNCTGPNKSICDDGLAGTGDCKCGKGFGGENCDKCAPGFFGNNCQECKCGNGICNEQGTCSCNAGFLLDVNNQCIKCKEGFFKSGNDCKPCAPGCESCEAETGVCSKCPQGYSYGDGTNSCTPNPAQCSPTQFFDGNTCQNCNIACGSCFGPTEKECLTCNSTTFYMEGICVQPSSSDGKCSTSEAFYANNTNRICEPCPGSCLDCSIQNFNVLDTTGNMQCTKCTPGFVLDDGKCVEECSEGKYADKTDSVCKACNAKCSSCKGPGENECIKCSENNFFVFNGECSTQCPSGYVAINGDCSRCHTDCLECSGSEIKQCTKCPDNRPVLVDGQCLEICPMGTYADKAGCQKCNSDCSSCTGPGSDQCLGCSDQSKVLLGGSCSGTCPTGSELIKTERLCQDSLTENILPPEGSNKEEQNQTQDKPKQSKQFVWWGILLIVIGSCVFLILLIYFVRTYAVKRRKDRTRKFGEQLDENIVAQNFKKLLRDNAREPSQPEMSYGSRSRSRHDKHISISSDDYNKWKKNSRSNEDLERFDVVIAGGSSSNDDNVSDNYQGGNIYRNSSKNGNGYRNNIRSTGSTASIRSKRTFTLPAEKDNNWGENWI